MTTIRSSPVVVACVAKTSILFIRFCVGRKRSGIVRVGVVLVHGSGRHRVSAKVGVITFVFEDGG